MNAEGNAELVGLIEKQLEIGNRLFDAVGAAMEHDVPRIGRTGNAAVMVAGLIESYYTCLETAHQKISQRFENNLDPSRWHKELLDTMALRVDGVRIAAVSEAAYGPLRELQRFRHFKRYYFELEYDWDRIDFLLKKLREAHPMVQEDLNRFLEFLREL